MTWQQFVLEHGWRARADHLAIVLGVSQREVERARWVGCIELKKAKEFSELFALWHGRAPRDDEWPKPRRRKNGGYQWLEPEQALLATLIGTMSKPQIAETLTARLRKITGDSEARRSPMQVQNETSRLGMQTRDVVGGITAAEAGREISSYGSVLHAIERGDLPIWRVGPLMVIPHEAWAKWKAARPQPPKDYVRLAPVFKKLGITSDSKPQEFQSHIETAQQFYPFGERGGTCRRGVWFIHHDVATKLVADRRAGLPMPWHGKPNPSNLKIAWRRWQERRHPIECLECRDIWAEATPVDYEDFCKRYPPLTLGQKRHITRKWNPGLRVHEVAAEADVPDQSVIYAIQSGVLPATKVGLCWYITRTDATLWKGRKCPDGDGIGSWLNAAAVEAQYGFSEAEVLDLVRDGKLISKADARGRLLVGRHQLRQMRNEIGYTEAQAAKRCKVAAAQLQVLLRGLDEEHRARTGRIKPWVIRDVQRRIQMPPGKTFAEASAEIGKPEHWIRYQLQLGRIEVVRAKWDRKTFYLTKATIANLKRLAVDADRYNHGLNADEWLLLSEAARRAGVSTGTIRRWDQEGALQIRRDGQFLRYRRAALETRARTYWLEENRYLRATPPAWFQSEQTKEAA